MKIDKNNCFLSKIDFKITYVYYHSITITLFVELFLIGLHAILFYQIMIFNFVAIVVC